MSTVDVANEVRPSGRVLSTPVLLSPFVLLASHATDKGLFEARSFFFGGMVVRIAASCRAALFWPFLRVSLRELGFAVQHDVA